MKSRQNEKKRRNLWIKEIDKKLGKMNREMKGNSWIERKTNEVNENKMWMEKKKENVDEKENKTYSNGKVMKKNSYIERKWKSLWKEKK